MSIETEAIKTKAEKLAEKMNNITNSFIGKADVIDDMNVESEELESLVGEVVSTDEDKSLLSPSQALNLNMLVEDFKYVRNTLKTNADEGRRIISNVTLSILSFDEDTSLADKAMLISAFADVNKSVAVNMDLYLKTYKEISTILVQLDKINDTQDKINGVDNSDRPEKEINTTDIIKQLNSLTKNKRDNDA